MTGIKLEVVESLEEAFDTKGVALALGRAYFNRDGFFDEKSDEYAELVRAYYWLPSKLQLSRELCYMRAIGAYHTKRNRIA